jgi:CRISPR-associated protein Csb1
MTTSNQSQNTSTSPSPLPFTFGGFTVPAGCRRIFITAELEPSNGDPRIQPTGFPDLGPVLYADPAEKDGLICLIESEASMANRLEEVCMENKYEGTPRAELKGLPYIKLTEDGTDQGTFVTASTIDGHRFASEYIMRAHLMEGPELKKANEMKEAPEKNDNPTMGKGASGKKQKSKQATPEFVRFVQAYMGMPAKDRCPAANVPRIFKLSMEYDPLALLHGFQISVKDKLTFVGLRSPRAITGSIVGLGCERITVPGVRIDPIGTGDAGQAIFQKPRISARTIEARFCIDVGLLVRMPIRSEQVQLLLGIALCKIVWFLSQLKDGLRLRTDCDLRISDKGARCWTNRIQGSGEKFDADALVEAASKELAKAIAQCRFQEQHSPFLLKHVTKAKGGDKGEEDGSREPDEQDSAGSEDE